MNLYHLRSGLKWALVGIILISACSSPPKPFSSELMPTEAIAEITEIADRPVWIRFLNSNSDSIATIGKNIKLGESIRTEGNALVQITLRTGMIIRMEGDSLLTIKDEQKLQLAKGQIVVWVPPQSNTNVQIIMTGAIATVNKNTTVYINSAKTQQIISLQGTVEVLPIDAKPIVIKSGQNLQISDRDGANLKPKTLTEKELKTQFKKIKLLSGFNSMLGSQQEIATTLKIPISPTEFIIPPNRPKNRPAKPINPPPEYYSEPEVSQYRAEPVRSPIRDPEPPPSESINTSVEELPPPPIQPEVIPADEPPQPEQPEELKP